MSFFTEIITSPLFIFIILLLILVLSIVFGKNKILQGFSEKSEGFVDFNITANMGDSVNIPQYSASVSVIKLYDNLYFDNKNGNLIEIDAPAFHGSDTPMSMPITPSATPMSMPITPSATPMSMPITPSATPISTPSNDIIANSSNLLASPEAMNYTNDLQMVEKDLKNIIQSPASHAMIQNIKTDVQSITSSPQVDKLMGDLQSGIQNNPSGQQLQNDLTTTKQDYAALIKTPEGQTFSQNLQKINEPMTGMTPALAPASTPALSSNQNNSNKITNIYVIDRNSLVQTYAGNATNILPNYPSAVSDSNFNFTYVTRSKNTDCYQVFYFAWGTTTFIHIFNQTKSQNIYSFLFDNNGMIKEQSYFNNGSFPTLPVLDNPSLSSNPSDNTFVILPQYGPGNQLYQLNNLVDFDTNNGNIVLETPESTQGMTIYNRSGNPITTTNLSNTVDSVDFISWTKNVEQFMVVYIANQKNTLVFVLTNDSTPGIFKIVNAVVFTPSGPQNIFINKPMNGNMYGNMYGTAGMPNTGLNSSEYWKWFWYWNTTANNSVQNPGMLNIGGKNFSEDYLLKTQIVPPVCPGCATGCPTCSNGNHTSNISTPPSSYATPSSSYKGGPVSSVLNNTVGTAGNVLNNTVDAAGNIITTTVGAAENVANNAINAIGSIGKGNATNVSNIYTTNSNGSNGSNGFNTLPVPTGPNSNGTYAAGNLNSVYQSTASNANTKTPIDNYSAYGALPSKGGNFIPITNDFSAFRK
jgi:hypothetical protein